MLKRLDVFKYDGKEYCFLERFPGTIEGEGWKATIAVKVINNAKRLEPIRIPIVYTERLSDTQQLAMDVLKTVDGFVCVGDHEFRLPTWNKLVSSGLAERRSGAEGLRERNRTFIKRAGAIEVIGHALDATNRGKF